MTAISAVSNIIYGYATAFAGMEWVIPIWLFFTGTLFFVRYGMIKNNRPCDDCPMKHAATKRTFWNSIRFSPEEAI